MVNLHYFGGDSLGDGKINVWLKSRFKWQQTCANKLHLKSHELLIFMKYLKTDKLSMSI